MSNPASPVIYYVHTDHLFRPVAMTSASQAIAWTVTYKPFGEVAAFNAQNTTMDLRFPGQWFQLETGLHYNWHRHYDSTTGRYLQPDPLIVDDGAASVGGLSTELTGTKLSVGNGALIAGTTGSIVPQAFLPRVSARALLPDGPSVYGYARQSPLVQIDASGLATGGFSPIPNTPTGTQARICLAEGTCTDHYVACTESIGNAQFSSGFSCGSCLRYCLAQGNIWPFQLCPY